MYDVRPFDKEDLFEIMNIVNREMKYDYSPDVYLNLHRAWPEGFMVVCFYRRIIGFIMSGITPQHAVRVLLLVIRSEFQSRGIGRLLMDEILLKAKLRGINRIRLEVRVKNKRAIMFYQKLGMRIIARADGFYNDGEDAFVMELVLTS